MPIDPEGLARIRATVDAGRPSQPALRVIAIDVSLTQDDRDRIPESTRDSFRRALVRRLEELGAWSPRAESTAAGARLTFALGRGTLTSLVREQLARPGRVEFVAHVRCPKFGQHPEIPGVEWLPFDNRQDIAVVSPGVDGVASPAPLRALFAALALPAGLRWLHGALRTQEGNIQRRAYCARIERLLPPSSTDVRATLDPQTLAPMLEVTLDAQGTLAYASWQRLMQSPNDPPEALILTVDDEVVGPVRFLESDAGPARLQVIPNSRMGSVSPELVGALWKSGPIELPFTLRDAPVPTS